jgi:uncharacterized membrane protein
MRTPRSLGRIAISLAAALTLTLALVLGPRVSWMLSTVTGWDAGVLCLLVLGWATIATSTPERTRERAAGEDPGRAAVNFFVLLSAGIALLSTVALARRAKVAAGAEGDSLVTLGLLNVALCWALTHTAFALRYAHLYYREDGAPPGGIEFPGGAAPDYSDFAYFAFTVGMCFQVSDASVSDAQIRRTVLLHAVLSFVYNTAILAFVLNVVFGVLV